MVFVIFYVSVIVLIHTSYDEMKTEATLLNSEEKLLLNYSIVSCD